MRWSSEPPTEPGLYLRNDSVIIRVNDRIVLNNPTEPGREEVKTLLFFGPIPLPPPPRGSREEILSDPSHEGWGQI